MAIGAGIGASLGIAAETTFNTGVTVTRFYEFNSESLGYQKNTVVGQGLRAGGYLPRSQRRVVTTSASGGDIELDLPTKGLGLLMGQAMGMSPSPVTVSTGVYSYTFTFGDLGARSFTAQVGVPQYGGTVTPKTLAGCKISSFELSVANGGLAVGRFTVDGASFTTGTALATPSYSTAYSIFHFAQGAITVAGSAVANIRDFTLNVDNNLKTDRYNLGSAGIKAAQGFAGFRKITGSVTAEFTDTTLLDRFLADTETGLVLNLTGDTIASTYKFQFNITVPACKFDGEAPSVSGPGPVDVTFNFEAYDNGTDQPLTIFYQTSDSAL